MEGSSLGSGFLSGPSGELLDLESSINRHQQTQLSHPSLTHQHQMNLVGGVDQNDHHSRLREVKGSTPKCFSMDFGKGKVISPTNCPNSGNLTEEDEPSYTEDGNGDHSNSGKGKKVVSPWPRMKWTDSVVQLLIAVVACVGDDGMVEGTEGTKRKSGCLQKKGKWKTVSRIMIGKGCHVSPQQCEDKFNDLNKRYKKLNDILGRGTSCRVVENPSLMESMPHLSAKAKDDVRKILGSKHLFYKEMCAYHNGQTIPSCHDIDLQAYYVPSERYPRETNVVEEEEDGANNDSDESDNEDDDDHANGAGQRMSEVGERNETDQDDNSWSHSDGLDDMKLQMAAIFQDSTKSLWERREWIKKQTLLLYEERLSLQAQSFELEKQRFKWLRYCNKKEKELERLRLENERLRLENEQSLLQMRQKKSEMSFRMSEAASFDPTHPVIDRLGGHQMNFAKHQ